MPVLPYGRPFHEQEPYTLLFSIFGCCCLFPTGVSGNRIIGIMALPSLSARAERIMNWVVPGVYQYSGRDLKGQSRRWQPDGDRWSGEAA